MVFNKLERFAVRTVSSVFSFLPEQDNAFDSAFSLSDFRFRICFGAFPCKDETFVADPDVSSFAADLHSGGACGNLLCPGMESDDSGVAEHHAPDPLQFSGIQGAECSADRLDRVCMGGLDSLGSLYLLAGNNSAAFNHPFFQHSPDIAGFVVCSLYSMLHMFLCESYILSCEFFWRKHFLPFLRVILLIYFIYF